MMPLLVVSNLISLDADVSWNPDLDHCLFLLRSSSDSIVSEISLESVVGFRRACTAVLQLNINLLVRRRQFTSSLIARSFLLENCGKIHQRQKITDVLAWPYSVSYVKSG